MAMEAARNLIFTGMINARMMCEKSNRTFGIVGILANDHSIFANKSVSNGF